MVAEVDQKAEHIRELAAVVLSENNPERGGDDERERERESVCVCVCV